MSILRPILKPITSAILQGLYGPGLAFHALTYDPDTYEMLGVKTGTGDLTEARTSTIYQPDHENVYRAFGSGEACYKGGRVVENLLTYSEDFSNAAWVSVNSGSVASGVADPDGGNNAFTITAGANTSGVRQGTITNTNGNHYIQSCWVRRRTGTGSILMLDAQGTTAITSAVTSSWQRITVNRVANGVAPHYAGFYLGTSGDEIDVYQIQTEESTGRSDLTTPSEYVPTTSAAAKKVFANVNGNSVASNVVTEAVGNPLPARTVENLAFYSEDATQRNGGVNLNNTNTATTVTFGSGDGYRYKKIDNNLNTDGNTVTIRVTVSSNDKSTIGVALYNGTVWNYKSVTLTPTPQTITISSTVLDAANCQFGLDNRTSFGGDGLTGTVTITDWQWEDTTGRVIDNFGTIDTEIPSEYVATTTAAASQTFYGELKNTVSSNVVTEADAVAGPIPVLAQPALTNSLTYSKPDTSNWTLTEGAKNLGSDQVTNGGFATDTDWSKGDGWTISGGTASCDGTQTAGSLLGQSISFTEGQIYKMTYTVSNYSAGSVRIQSNNNVGTHRSANGTYTEYIGPMFANQTNLYVRAESDFIGDIDNVIVEEVEQLVVNGDFAAGDDGNWTKGTGWSIGSGVASCDGTQTANTNLIQNVGLTTDTIYKITFTVSNYSAGNVKGFAGYTYLGTDVSANGTYTQYIRASNSSAGVRANSSFIGDIDDVIVIPAVIESTATGLDGTASAVVLTDDDGAAHEFVTEKTTISDDSNTHTARYFIKKDSDETRFPMCGLAYTGGTQVSSFWHLNTKTGATTARGSNSAGAAVDVRDAGDWWEVLASAPNNSSGNTNCDVYGWPADGAVFGTQSTAATGSITVANCELHLNSSIGSVRGSGFIATDGASASTNACYLTCPLANTGSATQGAWFMEVMPFYNSDEDASAQVLLSADTDASTSNYIMGWVDNNRFRVWPLTGTVSYVNAAQVAGQQYKAGVAFDEGVSKVAMTVDGVTAALQTDFGGLSYAGTVLKIGNNSNTENKHVILYRNIRRYDLPYDEAQAKIDDLMS